jgi:hypothetical protein
MRIPTPTLLLAGALVLLSPVSHAMVQTLTDTEMSRVNARGTADDRAQPQLPLPPGLARLFANSTATVTFQDAPTFASDLRALGLAPFDAPFYDGRAVLKAQLSGAPVDVQFDLSQLFLGSGQGVNMGVVQLRQLSATGTSLWIWGH